MEVTSCRRRELAGSLLEAAGGDLQLAVELYFEHKEHEENNGQLVEEEAAGGPGDGAGLVQPAGGAAGTDTEPARKRLRRDAELDTELTGEEARCYAELKEAVGVAAMSVGAAGGGVVPEQVLREVARRLPADAAELAKVAGMAVVDGYHGVIMGVVADYRRDGGREMVEEKGEIEERREVEDEKGDNTTTSTSLKLFHFTSKAGLDEIVEEGVLRAQACEGLEGVHLTLMDPALFTRGQVAEQSFPDTGRGRLEAGELDFYVEVKVNRRDELLEGAGERFFYHGDLRVEEGGWRQS